VCVCVPIPGEAAGTEAASTLTCGSSEGSVEELAALILIHRAAIGVLHRAVTADEPRTQHVQGEAAGRSMAVPVNWRAFEKLGLVLMLILTSSEQQ
jgi:hypothetical protein